MEQKLTKKEIREMWFEALESGNYKQGISRLNRTDTDQSKTFCCLGVLGDLCIKHNLLPDCKWEEDHNGILFSYGTEFMSYSHLPFELMKLVGIKNDFQQTLIAHANDTGKFTFNSARNYMKTFFYE